MKRYPWLVLLALVSSCDDDGGNGTMDAGLADGGGVTSDGELSSDASVACASQATQQARVACAADAVLATLTSAQRSTVAFALNDYATRSKWSNFPVKMNPRAGTLMNSLSATSQAAVLDLLTIALSSNGQSTATGILRADDYLATMTSGEYGSGLYSIAIFGTPSPTGDFEVMFGGHHMAYNLNFVGGQLYPVPQHLGAEPKGSFTLDGVAYDPLGAKGDAMFAIYDALDTAQRATAQLSGSFMDTIAAPSLDYNRGANRTSKTIYPTGDNRKGVKVSDLTTTQQSAVTDAIEQWVRQYPSELADALMTAYTGAYDDTLFGWAGSSSGPSRDAQNSYLRIDGPRVWIELAVQGGVVIRGQTHYHTIYRDKTMDYGGQF